MDEGKLNAIQHERNDAISLLCSCYFEQLEERKKEGLIVRIERAFAHTFFVDEILR